MAEADRVILHCLPCDLRAAFELNPILARKYVIAYCVWEASDLPEELKRLMPKIQEVWTCSEYCKSLFDSYHPVVARIPHVVCRPRNYTQDDLSEIQRLISFEDQCVYFLTIARLADRRKNTGSLISTFQRISHRIPDARLVVKMAPIGNGWKAFQKDKVVYINDHLSEGQLNALYSLASAVVSPHHSEGWGLTLSDAMLLRKPVVATGYSGNLEFMNPGNSLLVSYAEEPIRAEDRFYLFGGKMKWAYPSKGDLANKLLWLYGHRTDDAVCQMVERAYGDVSRFDDASIGTVLRARFSSFLSDDDQRLDIESGESDAGKSETCVGQT